MLEEAQTAGLDALIEPLFWRDGRMSHRVDDVVTAAVIAHDLGAPLLKVPVPEAGPGAERVDAVHRVVSGVGVPVLFLATTARGGRGRAGECPGRAEGWCLAAGRAVLEDPSPADIAKQLAAIVHPR